MSPMKRPKPKETKKQKPKRKLSQKALKPGAISEFHSWERKQIDRIRKKRELLARELYNCVPKSAIKLFGGDKWPKGDIYAIIRLIECANESPFIYIFGFSVEDYGGLEKFEKMVKILGRAWKNIVNVAIIKTTTAGIVMVAFEPIG